MSVTSPLEGMSRRCARIARLLSVTGSALLVVSAVSGAAGFMDKVADPVTGYYLWSNASNWQNISGIPDISTGAEIGEEWDSEFSGPAHATIASSSAAASYVEIAESFQRGRTAGSSLHILEGAKLTVSTYVHVGKDDLGYLTVDGELIISGTYFGNDLLVAHRGHTNAHGFVTISQTGRLQVDRGMYVMGLKMPYHYPSSSVGASVDQDSGSIVTVDGGTLELRKGLVIWSPLASAPGLLKIRGAAVVTQTQASIKGGAHYDTGYVFGGGILEIEGGDASVTLRSLEFTTQHLNPVYAPGVGDGPPTLKFSGDGVSTIRNIGTMRFEDGAVLDVSELSVPSGTYTLVDSDAIVDNGLTFAPGTDTTVWSMQLAGNDLQVTYAPEPMIGDVDLSGCVDDDDLNLLLANWNIGDEWGEGDLNDDLTVDDDDLSLLLANWGAGCSPAPDGEAIPEPASALILLLGLSCAARRRAWR